MGRPRLEGAPAQQIGAGLFDGPGSFKDLFLVFHRTGARGDHRPATLTDLHPAYPYHRGAWVKIAGNQLVRFGNMDDPLHPGEVLDGDIIHIPLVPQDADGGPFASRDRCGREPHFLDGLEHCFYLFLSGFMVHDNEHNVLPLKQDSLD
jgi:hypothetical protein